MTSPDPLPAMRLSGEVTRDIAVDADELYRWVSDVTRTPEWSPEVRRCDWLGDAPGAAIGARFRGRNRWRVTAWSRSCEVTVVDPGREFAFRTLPGRLAPDSTTWTFRFAPIPGGTRLTLSYRITQPLPAGQERLALLLLPHHRDRRPDLDASLGRLAEAAEGRRAVPQPELGQAHTAPGPLDMSAMYVMHRAFRRDLRDLADAVPATPLDDRAAWGALDSYWADFARTLHHHHLVEDEWIWPPLLERVDAAGDRAGRSVLESMGSEHALIDPLLERCAAGFRGLADGADAAQRDRLATDLADAAHVLGAHLAHEEADALPLCQQYLSQATWRDGEVAARREFGLADLRFTVPWAAREMPADQFDLAFAHGGRLIRIMVTLFGPRFDRRHRVAFGHLDRTVAQSGRRWRP